MEKNNLYINSLCTGDKSVYYSEGGSLPDTSVKDDINELLEDKYTTKVNVEFVYVDSTNIKHFGVLEVKEIDDYEGPYMADDSFYEETQLTDENLIDLFEFD
tara:strand:+ start:1185 stop:1490 length:306 start_codon:yes stop_codon:yes gene_type:complete